MYIFWHPHICVDRFIIGFAHTKQKDITVQGFPYWRDMVVCPPAKNLLIPPTWKNLPVDSPLHKICISPPQQRLIPHKITAFML